MSRRRRVLLWAGVLVVAVGAGLVGLRWAIIRAPGITLDNARRLHTGMKLRDIEVVLGGSATSKRDFGGGWSDLLWCSQDCLVQVHYNYQKERVVRVHCAYAAPTEAPGDRKVSGYKILRNVHHEPTVIDRLRRWLGI